MTEPGAPALALIWAMAQNRVIGVNNRLPWRLPSDMQFFMATTMAKPVIMGRKTFESMKAPLPGRTNIVISRNEDYAKQTPAGVLVASSFADALSLGQHQCHQDDCGEIMVAGGHAVYEAGLVQANRLYVTTVHAEIEGDTYFPEVDWSQWHCTWQRDYPQDGRHPHNFTIAQWDRVS